MRDRQTEILQGIAEALKGRATVPVRRSLQIPKVDTVQLGQVLAAMMAERQGGKPPEQEGIAIANEKSRPAESKPQRQRPRIPRTKEEERAAIERNTIRSG